MIDDEKLNMLNQQFQRIFTLPVTRLTFRELQIAIGTALSEDHEAIKNLTEALLFDENRNIPKMGEFIKKYTIPFRVAKQIQDSGEVLSMMATDILTQGDLFLFQNRMRRIDGGEFTFLSDTSGFLQLAEHIISRLEGVTSSGAGKGALSNLRPRLEALQNTIHKLL